MPILILTLMLIAIPLVGVFGTMFSDADLYENSDRDAR